MTLQKIKNKYATQLGEALHDISDHLWEIDANQSDVPYGFDDQALMGATKIFSTVVFDKIWDYAEKNQIPQEDRELFAMEFGTQIHEMLLKYTGKDTWKLKP